MVFSIRNTASVRCSVGVRFSEGPLWEVPLYYEVHGMVPFQSGTKALRVVYPEVVDVDVVLNPGDIACSGVTPENTSCVANIIEDGVYSVTVTMTNDIGSTQAMRIFNCELMSCIVTFYVVCVLLCCVL